MMSCWKKKIAVLVLVLAVLALLFPLSLPASAAVVSPDGWGWQNPLPQGNHLYDVWGTSPSDVFAVGSHGTILHYDGSSWNGMTSGTTNDLNGVWGSSASSVFAVGDLGTILRYNGSSWSPLDGGTTDHLRGVWGSASSDVFAVGANGTILRYDGSSWSAMDSGTIDYLRGVWGSASNDVFAVGQNGTVRHYDGSSWSPMTSGTSNYLYGVWGSASNDVFAVGENGTILHYNGSSWSSVTSSTTSNNLNGVWGSASNDVFAVGQNGTILNYDGSSWSSMDSGTTNHLRDVWGSASNDVFAVGILGTILHYDGDYWSSMDSGTSSYLYGVWGSAWNDVFAVGTSGTIRHYNGSSWSPLDSGTTDDLRGVWGSASSDVFAVGQNGTILNYDGDSWSAMTSGTSNYLYGVWGSASNNVFAVGTSGTILNYNGSAWSSMSSPTAASFRGVWGSASNDVFAVGTGGTILNYNGSSWSSIDSGTVDHTLNGVWGKASRDVFAVGGNGTILHYPSIVSVTPSSGNQGQTLDVTIIGIGTDFTEATEVSFGADIDVSFTRDSSTQITANITIDPAATTGARDVSVTTPEGTATLAGGFTVQEKAHLKVEILEPETSTTFSTCQSFTVGVTVENTGEATALDVTATVHPGATASVEAGENPQDLGDIAGGGLALATWTLHCDSSGDSAITVTPAGTDENTQEPIPEANLEPANVTVHQELKAHLMVDITEPLDGTTFSACQDFDLVFTVSNTGEAHALNVPATIDPGATAEVDDLGAGVSYTVTIGTVPGGGTVGPFTETMHCVASGDSTITVTPGGTDENTGKLIPEDNLEPASVTVTQAPTVTAVNPSSGKQGETLDVTITGTGFTGTEVSFGAGITVNSFNVDSPTQITANITIAADATTGARDVSVTTPRGTGTLPGGFTVEEVEKKGGLLGCACSSIGTTTSASELLIGWGIIGLCWGTAYYLVRRGSKSTK